MSRVSYAKRGKLHISNGTFEGVNSATLARNVYDLMLDHGEYEGEGCYQKVFTFPSIEGVIKVNIGDAPAAHYAISVAPKLSNPHVPQLIKYYGTFVHPTAPPNWGMKPRVWVYQVEKLDRAGYEVYNITDALDWADREDYDNYTAKLLTATNNALGDNCQMGEAILAIRDWVKSYAQRTNTKPRIDLHAANWMLRPITRELVINDPIAAPSH